MYQIYIKICTTDLMAKMHKREYSLGGNTLIGRSGGAPDIYLEIHWWISRT